MELEADERQLTSISVVEYLLARGLLTEEDIVSSNVTVTDISRRNRNFVVNRERGPSYLLKQGSDPERRAAITIEATLYRFLYSDIETHKTCRHIPPYYGYDEKQHVLCLGYVERGQSLASIRPVKMRLSECIAAEMARVLSTLHQITTDQLRGTNGSIPKKQGQWVLSLGHPLARSLPYLSTGNVSLIRLVQQFDQFSSGLQSLGEEWQCNRLIHGDLKWQNWLAVGHERTGQQRIYLVDWELAGLGDPCWDVASVFNDYLSFWVLSIPVTGEHTAQKMLELTSYPLDRMQPAMRAFWYTYVREMKLGAPEAEDWLLRSVRYTAARLVQTAFEQTQDALQITGNVTRILQVSLNMLKRPADAARELLGIPVEAARLA